MSEGTGFPSFFEETLRSERGAQEAERVLEGMRGPRAVTLRANALKTDAAHVAEALGAAGIAFERAPFYEDAFILKDAREGDIRVLPMYVNGEIYLQSLSSMLPPLALCPRENADILDMAAAPGGKTTQMAALTHGKASVTACEINRIRAEKLKHNLLLQGAGRVSVMVRDARKMEDFFRFDQILLDAPCSGSGTMLLSDTGSYRAFSRALVKNSAVLQLELFKKALSILKVGGEMVYSTCSILMEEDEAVVKAALKGARAEIVPISLPAMEALPLLTPALEGAVCVRPTPLYEGFFMVRIRKLK